MLSHWRKMRNTLQDFTERLTCSVSGTWSHFLLARSVLRTTCQPGSPFAGSFSGSSGASPVSTVLTQGHQSRCWELGSKKLLEEVSELLEEQSRGLLVLRRGLDGTSTLSPCPILRVMGRFLCVGLAASSSPPRSIGLLGGSEALKREMDGEGLFSCSEPGEIASWLRVSILRGDVGTGGP